MPCESWDRCRGTQDVQHVRLEEVEAPGVKEALIGGGAYLPRCYALGLRQTTCEFADSRDSSSERVSPLGAPRRSM